MQVSRPISNRTSKIYVGVWADPQNHSTHPGRSRGPTHGFLMGPSNPGSGKPPDAMINRTLHTSFWGQYSPTQGCIFNVDLIANWLYISYSQQQHLSTTLPSATTIYPLDTYNQRVSDKLLLSFYIPRPPVSYKYSKHSASHPQHVFNPSASPPTAFPKRNHTRHVPSSFHP